MSSGGGKGGGGKTPDYGPYLSALSDAAKQATAAGKEILDISRPVREQFYGQLAEVLRTGGVGAQIPIAQQGVEATRSAAAGATEATKSRLASAGLGRTPYAQRILSGLGIQGDIATAQVPLDIAKLFLGAAPNAALGAPQSAAGLIGSGVSGAGSAASTAAGGQIAAQNNLTSVLTSLIASQGATALGSGAGGFLGDLFGGGAGAGAGKGAAGAASGDSIMAFAAAYPELAALAL